MRKSAIAITLLAASGIMAANARPAGAEFSTEPSRNYYTRGQEATLQDDGDFFDNWIAGKLSLGLGISSYSLSDGKRPADPEKDFLGNINELHTVDGTRLVPVVDYAPCDYLTLGFTYFDIKADTKNFNNHLGDGVAELKGPVVSLEAQYPLCERHIFPHAGFGIAWLSGDFKEDTWWRLGYSNPEAWQYYGSPSDKRRAAFYRYIDVDDVTETFFTIGVSIQPIEHLRLDISYRRLKLDPDCEFGYADGNGGKAKRADGDFDMSGDLWLFSVSYMF